ncbi:MAG: aminotransferase class V-fold PLP-dependent enzyme [Oscillospiraceae bacterium]|nr:aminotransferase class V-fold PLP-dependent enzyme [Oscillospiraceae bacterium]
MIRFECDYGEGAHPEVIRLLSQTNMEQTPGYGTDVYCDKARAIIRGLCGAPDADVHFLVGGTQANTTVIASALRPYEGVLCAATGHINAHETGAIEATGHKVLALPEQSGKITAAQIESAWRGHINDDTFEHTVRPGMVYLSQPTEYGTLYSKVELSEISGVCRSCGLPLFVDGARLGYGLASPANDLTLQDMARLCDVFYIGGTKVGALFGEAVVITQDALKTNFRYSIKQRGGMLAKGRLLGLQFIALLENGLYFDISKRAVDLALRIKSALEADGCPFLLESFTNQQFPILPDDKLAALEKKYVFSFWAKPDADHTAVRICTSWATREADVDALIGDLA